MRKLRGLPKIDSDAIDMAIKELQKSLLGADVKVELVFQMTENIKKEAKNTELKRARRKDFIIKLVHDELVKYNKEIYRFCLDFIDAVNEDLTPIKEKNCFSELYLNYDLTLTIQRKEKHIIVVDGKEHTANLRVYEFEQLEKDTKVEILTIIKENFKKEYYKCVSLEPFSFHSLAFSKFPSFS